MPRNWRLLDTGLRSAAQNIALDRALLEARRANEIPTTLRFFRFTPCALLGLQQSAGQELGIEYCAAHSIPVQRRVTGGAALYMDARQLGWCLYVDRRELGHDDARTASKHLCHAVAAALSAFGCDARHRRYDEIEVEGRTVGGCAYGIDGDAAAFFGWVFLRLGLDTLAGVLRMPPDHVPEHLQAAAEKRVTDLARTCGREPDIREVRHNIAEAFANAYDAEFNDADLGSTEERRYHVAVPQIDARDWVELVARPAAEAPRLEAAVRTAGGTLRAHVIADSHTQTLKRVWFGGDVIFDPQRAQYDLESELRELPFGRIDARLEWFFASHAAKVEGARCADFGAALARALGRPVIGHARQ